MTETLVVGYGSPLRTDDAVGREVAAEIERRGLPGVEVRSMTQLVPEVVETMATVGRVVFIDASIEVETVTTTVVEPRPSPSGSHHADPGGLLGLMGTLGLAVPATFLVSVPAHHLGLGEGLSPQTAESMWLAVAEVEGLLGNN